MRGLVRIELRRVQPLRATECDAMGRQRMQSSGGTWPRNKQAQDDAPHGALCSVPSIRET
eukprot:2783699-Pyramimonas_sp.AAC.1